jgi:Ser/Thr protein kinase RdoA (MazF antagonist)
VAGAFGLGAPLGPLRALPGLSTDRVYRLSSTRGDWVVKIAVGEPSTEGSTLELAALAAGVATAPAVPPPQPAIGLWGRVDGAWVRVSALVTGASPSRPATQPVASWLGMTVAALAALDLPAAAARAILPDEPFQAELRAALDDFDAVISEAWAAGPPRQLGHRDINARNIVITGSGPLLLDFDGAGATLGWWEVVHHSFLLACDDLGPQAPSPATVRASVEAYAAAGGRLGDASPLAFAGMLSGLIEWVRAAARDRDAAVIARASASLPLIARNLTAWARLLR